MRCLKILRNFDVSTSLLSEIDLQHILGMAKLCGLGFVVLIFAWSPFALLCTFTLFADAQQLNIYLTMVPPIMAKVTKYTFPTNLSTPFERSEWSDFF